MVEVTGFEPAAPSSRTKCSTKLSHTSKYLLFLRKDIIAHFIAIATIIFANLKIIKIGGFDNLPYIC